MPKNIVVKKANDLIVAKYALRLEEMRLILYLTSLIRTDDKDFEVYEITVEEFCEFTGSRRDHFYSEFRNMCDSLLKKRIDIHTGDDVIYTCWLSSARYCHDQGKVQLKFSPELKPLLLNLKRCFTTYELKNTRSLRSVYSIRIYEMLKQYESFGQRTFLLDELKSILCIDQKYSLYGTFKQYVLQPAQRELLEKCDIYFDFAEVKAGRKVYKVQFFIYSNVKNRDPMIVDPMIVDPMIVDPMIINSTCTIKGTPPAPADKQPKTAVPYQRQPEKLTEKEQQILNQLLFITEDIPNQSRLQIYYAAGEDPEHIRQAYNLMKSRCGRIDNAGAYLYSLVKNPKGTFKPVEIPAKPQQPKKSSNEKINRFVNFNQRDNDYDELEKLEYQQFKIAIGYNPKAQEISSEHEQNNM